MGRSRLKLFVVVGRMMAHPRFGTLALVLATSTLCACAEEAYVAPPQLPPPPPPPPAPPPGAQPPAAAIGETTTTAAPTDGTLPTLPPPYDPSAPSPAAQPESPPAAAQWTATYPTGRWIYADGYGWMWVPNESAPVVVEDVPYVYLYTPSYGWTWYVSPWGMGPYHYGVWVHHPWRPVGWRHGWVARPHVVVRIGPHYAPRPYHPGYRAPHPHYGGHRR